MGSPNEFNLVQNLQTALQQMATERGYHFSVQSAAVKLDPNTDVESLLATHGARPFVIIELKPDEWAYSPASRTTITVPVTIHWVNDSNQADDNSRLLTYLQGCADVERAIAADVSRGGFAFDTQITKRSYDTAVDGSLVWAMVDVNVLTRRVYGSPDA